MTSVTGKKPPLWVRLYERDSRSAEGRGATEHRRRMLAGLRGRVLELGAGDGLNFGHYPAGVTEVVAVEPEPHMRERAEKAASDAPVPVRVVDGHADELPIANESFDAAVVSLVLCSVPDQTSALRELRRVVRPGGELRFYEHVRAMNPLAVGAQRAIDLFWPRIAGGCHTSRDTGASIERAGFRIESLERFAFASTATNPPMPHIIGTARRA